MKILQIVIILISAHSFSQGEKNIPIVWLHENVSTHFTSEKKLLYTDLSAPKLVGGDLPMENILRIKPYKKAQGECGYATIVGEDFFMQFLLVYAHDVNNATKHVNLDNLGKTSDITSDYKNLDESLTSIEIEAFANAMMKEQPSLNNVVSKKHKMRLKLNNVWVVDDYLFFDYSAKNKTNLIYNIDETRYKIIDKKLVKAQSNQDQLLEPKFVLNKDETFDEEYRNIIVLEKFTFPEDKNFIIEIAENQISGRTTTLHIAYSDILSAKTFRTQ